MVLVFLVLVVFHAGVGGGVMFALTCTLVITISGALVATIRE
jgi:hypothetical protein